MPSNLKDKIKLLVLAKTAEKLQSLKKASALQSHPMAYDWHDGHTMHHNGLQKDEHPHTNAHGPQLNDQAGGNNSEHFHKVMSQYGTINPSQKTNLKFYHGLEQLAPNIEQHAANAGYQTYLAGGKYGKPDLANKNYNTKHLMVYDPSPHQGGDFQDENYTKAWRQAHELAHAQTLQQINNKYGEGRRLGKLGIRSPREMKRAVEWEHHAAHKQRDIMKQLGYNMPDEEFNREYNTVMGDAVHRAITGQFTDPHEMGFYPHSQPVPLETSLKLIDDHAKSLGLNHEDDTLRNKSPQQVVAKSEMKRHLDDQGFFEELEKNRQEYYLMWPVTINGESHDTQRNLPFHITLRWLSRTKTDLKKVRAFFAKHDAKTPHNFDVYTDSFEKPGKTTYVLKLKNHPEWMDDLHDALDKEFGDDKFSTYIPHITISQEMWNHARIHGVSHLDIKVQPLELWHNDKVLWSLEEMTKAEQPEKVLKPCTSCGNHLTTSNAKFIGTQHWGPRHPSQDLYNCPKCDSTIAVPHDPSTHKPESIKKDETSEAVQSNQSPEQEQQTASGSPEVPATDRPSIFPGSINFLGYLTRKMAKPRRVHRHIAKHEQEVSVQNESAGVRSVPAELQNIGNGGKQTGDRVPALDAQHKQALRKDDPSWHAEQDSVDNYNQFRQNLNSDAAHLITAEELKNMHDVTAGSDWGNSEKKVLLRKILRHPNAPKEIQEQYVNDTDIGDEMAKNPFLHPDIQHKLLDAQPATTYGGKELRKEMIDAIDDNPESKVDPTIARRLREEIPKTSMSSRLKGLVVNQLDRIIFYRHGHDVDAKLKVKLGTNKLREVRDLADANPDKQISKKALEQVGLNPKDLGITHLIDGKGNLSADKIQQHIDKHPHHEYGFSHTEYGEHIPWLKSPDDIYDTAEYKVQKEAHEEAFDPSDYDVNKADYINDDKAREHWSNNFDPADYNIDKRDPRYKMEDGSFDEDKYEEDLDDAQREHDDEFDISNYEDDDRFLNSRDYEQAESDARDRHNDNFEFDSSDYKDKDEAHDEAVDEQRHSPDPSQVFQLNLTQDHIKKMKEAGVLGTFQNMNLASLHSSHPVKFNSLGWVRYTNEPGGGVHIDEIQSDLGQSFVKQAAAQIRQAVEDGRMDPSQAAEALADANKKWPDDHYDKIKSIIFQDKHPNELIHEAFLQHLRDKGQAGKDVKLWDVPAKAKISLGDDIDVHIPASSLVLNAQHLEQGKEPMGMDDPEVAKQFKHTQKWMKQNNLKNSSEVITKLQAGHGVDFEQNPHKKIKVGQDITKVPAHMQATYSQQPKKFGYKGDAKYGDFEHQTNPRLQGQKMWNMKLRKVEDPIEVWFKAQQDATLEKK